MAARKPFLKTVVADTELLELLQKAKETIVSNDELHEQRVSFAFGNALESELITKDSVRKSSNSIRLSA